MLPFVGLLVELKAALLILSPFVREVTTVVLRAARFQGTRFQIAPPTVLRHLHIVKVTTKDIGLDTLPITAVCNDILYKVLFIDGTEFACLLVVVEHVVYGFPPVLFA